MLRLLVVVPLLCCLQGCDRASERKLKPVVSMSDANAVTQLVTGFYGVEANSWRWTARRFVVLFPGSRELNRSHSLKLNVFVPATQIEQLGPITLTAVVDGVELSSETFRQPGVHTYVRTVPEAALKSNIIPVIFSLDKAVLPAFGDGREFGLVVNDAQLKAN